MAYISEISPDGGTTNFKLKDKNGYLYMTCTTGRNTAAKVISQTGFELITGMTILIKFTSTGSSNPSSGNITLNINDTGDKEIVDTDGVTITYQDGDEFYDGKFKKFQYTGTKWILLNKTFDITSDIYVDDDTLYLPTHASVSQGTLIIG